MSTSAPPMLPPALEGEGFDVEEPGVGRLRMYRSGPPDGGHAPLLLVHTVNAAASAYEVRPVFEHRAARGPVYALDLPGFGHSERGDRPYSIRMMTDAVLAALKVVQGRHPGAPVDGLAVSLGCEFLARAAVERPGAFRKLALVSPTGFRGTTRWLGPEAASRAIPGLYSFFSWKPVGTGLFGLLTRPGTVRYFLERTYGSARIDEGLWAYDVLTVQQPGARFAPLAFVSGLLFSRDISRLYDALTQPVWASHGVRGDFTDYQGLEVMRQRPTWTVTVFQTGALPHFEVPGEFLPALDRFLDGTG